MVSTRGTIANTHYLLIKGCIYSPSQWDQNTRVHKQTNLCTFKSKLTTIRVKMGVIIFVAIPIVSLSCTVQIYTYSS